MATSFTLRFPANRYHATPWGHHVNEGLVEWPPSPWRLLRTLISLGYTTLGWDDGVPAAARRLIESLASCAPRYKLPPASLGHSRHYMPVGTLRADGTEDTTLVFDAFARPGGGAVCVTWPVDLDEECHGLLQHLLGHVGYVGRAESWVEAVLGDATSPTAPYTECWPCTSGERPPGRNWEQISLLVPQPSDDYSMWRAQHLAAQPPSTASRRGARAAATVPGDIWTCLTATTAELQAAGWSQPPGSQRILYWRHASALEVAPVSRPRHGADQRVQAVLLALTNANANRHALPQTVRTVPQAELLHRSFAAHLGRGDQAAAGHELVGIGPDGQPLDGHRHAHVLPLDLDADGHLDHVLVWAPDRLGPEAQHAIGRVRETWQKRGGETPMGVAIAAAGELDAFRRLPDPWGAGLSLVLGTSRRWRSLTPFVLPRFLKKSGKNSLFGQLQSELACRDLPALVAATPRQTPEPRFRPFVLSRTRGGTPPPAQRGFDLEIELAAEISGPLCLGYGSHFGLGLFVPA